MIHMSNPMSRKSSKGRPSLDLLEKQRRLVARLFESCTELEHQLLEESSHEIADDDQKPLLLSTFNQRMTFAREAARHEKLGRPDEAKVARQKLNLFRPQGLTEEVWNALPDNAKRLAPGKPKMPKELELARLEIKRDEELEKLRSIETETGEEQSDIEALRVLHGNNQIGRPGKDILGALDRQMHIAFYKRRDLIRHRTQHSDDKQHSGMGRPRKSFEERFAYFTSIIDHCQKQILDGETKLDLVHLQLRYLKRLRDRANRLRLQIRNPGLALVALKKDLAVVEGQLKVESDLVSDFQDNYITMSNSQIEVNRKSVESKIQAFDAIEFSSDIET